MAEKKVPFDQKKNKKPLKNKKQTNKARTTLKILILALLLLFLIASGAAAAMVFGYVNNAPPFDPARLIPPKTSLVYDYRDELVTLLHYEQNRTEIALNEIPRHVQEAFIAIEDERFHRHFGFDVIGIVRAAIANFQAGTVVQGASTITQQLVKNSFLSPEITTERKVQEIWLAVQTERRYSKDEILEMYLNWIYFGNGAYGVEAAAQTYFDKSASDLSLAEGAMLAAAIRSPNYYNPHDNETAAEERMKKVLSNMLRVGFISEAEYESALGEELLYAEPRGLGPFPHFIDYLVHTELIRILTAMPEVGTREEAYRLIYEEGLQVFTTLNPVLQAHVEDVLSRNELYPSTVYVNMDRAREMIAGLASDRDLTRAELQSLSLVDPDEGVPQPQAAMVIADPATGRIMALGGGREYLKGVDQLLRFTSLRQTGSAIKPIIAYAPALEEGVLAGASSALDDSPFIGPDGNWFPENFDFRFRGMVPLREALYISYNIPAVRAFQALGTRLGVRYAELMGISTIDPGEVDNLSLALGAFHHGVSAID
ncbi:MAG TPA: transglycosylase domain-containing protein, partial [Candidatus Limnocylindrales bacterium]|nr:transglycosylase domain-containing protein [Candidatus Limnocylindrales bacterium]